MGVRLTKQQGRAAHTQPAHTTPHTTVTTGTHNPPMCIRFLIPTSPQYIDIVFLYLTQKNHLKQFRLLHQRTLAVSYTPACTVAVVFLGGFAVVKLNCSCTIFLQLYKIFVGSFPRSHVTQQRSLQNLTEWLHFPLPSFSGAFPI